MDKELALIIKEQLTGTYVGHMANIPFNPVLHSIFSIITDNTFNENKNLATALRKVADALDGINQ